MPAVSSFLNNLAANARLEEGLVPLPADHDTLGSGLMGGKPRLWGPKGRPAKLDPLLPPVEELRGGPRILNAVMRNAMALRRLPDTLDGDKAMRQEFAAFFNLLKAPLSPLLEQAVIHDQRVRSVSSFMQTRMMAGERRIERAWSGQLLGEGHLNIKALRNFWYYDNYLGLCDTELGLLHKGEPGLSLTKARDSIAVVGGGSLPLTGIMLHDMTGVPVTVIDYNARCCQMASRMLRTLGMEKHVKVAHADGRHFDYNGHSIIIIAANLNGVRETVGQALTTGHPKRVMLRSVDGLRTLLYKPVTYDDISGYGLQHVGQADRTERYFNSSQAFVPPFGLHGEMGHDIKLDQRFSRYMPNMHMKKNIFLVAFNAQ
jgi:hypothetical protein